MTIVIAVVVAYKVETRVKIAENQRELKIETRVIIVENQREHLWVFFFFFSDVFFKTSWLYKREPRTTPSTTNVIVISSFAIITQPKLYLPLSSKLETSSSVLFHWGFTSPSVVCVPVHNGIIVATQMTQSLRTRARARVCVCVCLCVCVCVCVCVRACVCSRILEISVTHTEKLFFFPLFSFRIIVIIFVSCFEKCKKKGTLFYSCLKALVFNLLGVLVSLSLCVKPLANDFADQ